MPEDILFPLRRRHRLILRWDPHFRVRLVSIDGDLNGESPTLITCREQAARFNRIANCRPVKPCQ